MALIGNNTKIAPNDKDDNLHDETWKATYKVFEYGGKKYIQIDTYGRKEREKKDEPSQIIQIELSKFKEMFGDLL